MRARLVLALATSVFWIGCIVDPAAYPFGAERAQADVGPRARDAAQLDAPDAPPTLDARSDPDASNRPDAARPDANPPDAPPPSGPPREPPKLGAFSSCSDSCDCAGKACRCTSDCQEAQCGNTICSIDCDFEEGQNCEPKNLGDGSYVRCKGNGSNCIPRCSGDCSMFCNNPEGNCELYCEQGAVCRLKCVGNPSNCLFKACSGPQSSCEGGWRQCGGSC